MPLPSHMLNESTMRSASPSKNGLTSNIDGIVVGAAVGPAVGVAVGETVVGLAVGDNVGDAEGRALGEDVGDCVGLEVGDSVGDAVGDVDSTYAGQFMAVTTGATHSEQWLVGSISRSLQPQCSPVHPLLQLAPSQLRAH
jgi:hypothetical protein